MPALELGPERSGVVGIDLAKRRIAIGWPYWGMAASLDFGKKPGNRNAELVAMRLWLVSKIPSGAHLWIEKTTIHGSGAATLSAEGLAETRGMVLSASPWAGHDDVGQSTWKAQVVGNGHASKDDVELWLRTEHPDLRAACSTEDEVDAMCVGIYGTMRMGGTIDPPSPKAKRRPRATPAA